MRSLRRLQGRKPLTLREDFCGTGLTACSWVEQSQEAFGHGVLIWTRSPIHYGLQKPLHQTQFENAKTRMDYIQGNVLDDHPFKSDVDCRL